MNVNARVILIFALSYLLITAPFQVQGTVGLGPQAPSRFPMAVDRNFASPIGENSGSRAKEVQKPSLPLRFGPRSMPTSLTSSRPIRPSRFQQSTPSQVTQIQGESSTLMPDGQILLIGGEGANGPSGDISLKNPQTNAIVKLNATLLFPRSWHTATLLPD